jgi:acyl-homoserine lactone acylase PvdQ
MILGGRANSTRMSSASVCALALVLVPLHASAGDSQPPPVPDKLRAYAIVPPGQEGNVTAEELAVGDFGPHYDDQRETYAALVNDDDVTEEELPTYFHSMQFGPEGEIERTYEPAPGVTVYRDAMGIPHIYGDSLNSATFALGYVSAEDRLWQMDVFRHAARGTLSEFVGAGENDQFLQMDIVTRREGYTEAEIQQMFEKLDDKFGSLGTQVQEGLTAYTEGVNAYIDELKTSEKIADRPVEYEATGNPFPIHPEPWTEADTLFLVVLQLRVFGETAGGELDNAALLAHLRKRLGSNLGTRVFGDLVFENEPRSYTSISKREGAFPSQALGSVDWSSVALPDNAVEVARSARRAEILRTRILGSLGFKAPASNAILVSAAKSAGGNPLQIGAPQVGYAVPAFFLDVDVHAPGVDFRGPAVPGASALIPLGRGRDYAWSLTTGYSDAVDVRAELLCDPDGGEPDQSSNGYVFQGECLPMDERTETFIVKPPPTDPSPPRVEERTFYRTLHGPVFARGRVEGQPVAFVKQRFFWQKEIDSVPQFLRWNTQVDSIEDFRDAAADFTMSFNAFYADGSDIGYFHVGRYPRRPRGVHPALPVWGTGAWEWKGRFPFRRHPQVVNPQRGWVVNWNNKPSLGWDNYDGIKWGSIHRVELLADEMRKQLGHDDSLTASDIVDVIRVAATQDVRGLYLGPAMLEGAGGHRRARIEEALDLVRQWVEDGAHRRNRDGDDDLDDAAIALFDRWYVTTVHNVFDDELGKTKYGLVPAPVLGSSMWFDFSSYLERVFLGGGAGMARNYCDDRKTNRAESCRHVIVKSLRESVAALAAEQGPDPSSWTAPAEWIEFQAFGAGSVDRIPWQNRGTHNHVVEILD